MKQLSIRSRRSPASVPQTFVDAHFRGLETTTEFRKRLGNRIQSLISLLRGDLDHVAIALGMLPWKIRQIADGAADPTLGEIGRIANCFGQTLESFIAELLGEAIAETTSPPGGRQ